MDEFENVAFQIISAVGTARSTYIQAIQKAKAGDFDRAEALIEEGSKIFLEGHHAHAVLLQQEANNTTKHPLPLLIIHAEDQLMSAEAFKILAQEFIDVYKRVETLEKKG